MRMTYPVLIDGNSVADSYGDFEALPTTFFLDRNGAVVAAQMGMTTRDDLEKNIKKALGIVK
jgi:cytochrome c biogenesis protein CcmG/thiol:disulfide interchange protein DsbE